MKQDAVLRRIEIIGEAGKEWFIPFDDFAAAPQLAAAISRD